MTKADMIAARTFRMKDETGTRTVKQGERYAIPPAFVDFHIETGRGKPVKTSKKD